ncbi:transglutaminase domain-containing protein [Microbacterium lushaniae]|uniref:Transglutaminase domain-containing protein n=1 Tax=Microbacterium lushaniae TaxID=2614639 RepID=A0A5J6L614_9MICO|nr:transglutaminase domain-containing protein [Microbacterium lushaniae]
MRRTRRPATPIGRRDRDGTGDRGDRRRGGGRGHPPPAPPIARAGSGGLGTGSTIDPTLELGDDLRQPRETEVLTVRSSASEPPYLRAVTLSDFDGSVWEPDTGRTTPLGAEEESFPALEVDPGIEVDEQRATVEIVDLNSPWLPVPFPATTVTGLDGAWGALAQNRTVVARSGSTQGQAYEVESAVPRPTVEQIRGIEAGGQVREESYLLPDDLPAIIEQTAREVTVDAQSDFEALQALQAWFRSSEFEYSLEAPVEEGFDGSGALAVADFLAVRQGYCVHYASAFALMARTLDMPSRIVVGYLPGMSRSDSTDGETVYSVSSSQLHSWPEVHFPGVGWVPFEPTNSLGTPTSFSSASAAGAGAPADRAPEDALQPDAGSTASPTAGPRPQDDLQAGSGGTSTTGGVGPWPGVGTGMLLLALLALPGVLRELRRRRAVLAAEGGDAGAAWLALQELAIDLGIPVPGAESPRAFGARLTRDHGASETAVGALVAGIERSSYAGVASRFDHRGGLAPALAEARAGMLASVTPGRRILSVAVPRSLVIRPGSAYAHPPEAATAR